jgi:hypothetical protein
MRTDGYDDLRDASAGDARRDERNVSEETASRAPSADQPVEEEAEPQGRDVHDISRTGMTHGRDVLTDAEEPDIESHGRTVVDRSHIAEARGVDVIDLGPSAPDPDSPQEPQDR